MSKRAITRWACSTGRAVDFYVEIGGLSYEFRELPMHVARAAANYNLASPDVNGGLRVTRFAHFSQVSHEKLRRCVKGVGPQTVRLIENMLADRGLEMLP